MTAYATVAELAQHLGHQDSLVGSSLQSTSKNDRWELALDSASRLVEQDTGRVFTSRTATKVLVSDGDYVLHVPDLVSVTTLKVDDDADGTFETTLTTADYELNTFHDQDERWPFDHIVRVDTYWPYPYRNGRKRLVEIAGTWGWSAVPSEIKQATIIMAARILQRGNAALGVQGVSDFGPFSIRANDPDYGHLIQPFRKIGVA